MLLRADLGYRFPIRARRASLGRPGGSTMSGILARSFATLVALLLALSAQLAFASDVTPSARVSRGVIVREQPTTESRRVGGLGPGDHAVLIEDLPGWWKVRLADGTIGYVSKTWTVVVAETTSTSQPLSAPLDAHACSTSAPATMPGRSFSMS